MGDKDPKEPQVPPPDERDEGLPPFEPDEELITYLEKGQGSQKGK
ncbi:MAG: hypothetical protein ACRDH6_08710 [Actinomycetota bacterium]